MPYEVIVTPEVARLRAGDAGSRNVRVGDKLHTFNRNPVVLEDLPDEIKNDPYLIVTETGTKKRLAPVAPQPREEFPDFVEVGSEGALDDEPAAEPAAKATRAKRGRPAKATAKK